MTAKGTLDRRRKIERIRTRWRRKVVMHLCDRSLVTEQAWKAMFLQLVKDVAFAQAEIARVGDPVDEVGFDPREPLVWTWCVLDTMPNDHDQRYQALRERSADGTGIEDRADAMRHQGYALAKLPTAIDVQIPWLAALARILDDDLAALQYWPDDVTTWQSDHWRPPGYECFVVPVRREHRLGDGRTVQRRGMQHHAVLPQRIGSLHVAVHLHPDGAAHDVGTDPNDWVFGVATFPGMTVVPIETPDEGFRLSDAPLPGDVALVTEQAEAAIDAAADVAVWPELTMPGARLELLVSRLSAAPLTGGRIPLVVAGSWHVPRPPGERMDGHGAGDAVEHVNRCEVMLGHGEPFLLYDKRRRFPFVGRTEDIRTGRTLPVVVMEDRLVGIAICRDNCDDNAKEGYGVLPLDLVIVPSMGQESTVAAHERHAKGLWSRQGTVTMVVQQNPVIEGSLPAPGPYAFSFIKPDDAKRPPVEQNEPFRTLNRTPGP